MSNEVRLLPGTQPDWCCRDLDVRVRAQSTRVWCVPACVAMLSARHGRPLSEAQAARMLGQEGPPPVPLDHHSEDAYRALQRLLERSGMRELFEPQSAAMAEYDWLKAMRGPVLVSAGFHALICVGTCADSIDALGHRQPAWRVIDPRDGRIAWRALSRSGFTMQFAFA